MTDELLNGFCIGSYQVYPREERIVGPGESHHLEPKVMQVLVTLAANPGRTVSRNEILEAVWSDVVVGDEVLSRAISLLRGYFKDERTQPKFIRTVPRLGYDLIAAVTAMAQRSKEHHCPAAFTTKIDKWERSRTLVND